MPSLNFGIFICEKRAIILPHKTVVKVRCKHASNAMYREGIQYAVVTAELFIFGLFELSAKIPL